MIDDEERKAWQPMLEEQMRARMELLRKHGWTEIDAEIVWDGRKATIMISAKPPEPLEFVAFDLRVGDTVP